MSRIRQVKGREGIANSILIKVNQIGTLTETLDAIEHARSEGRTDEVVGRQLSTLIGWLQSEELAKCILAYEPVWAIGNGKTATPEQAQEVHVFIRDAGHQWRADWQCLPDRRGFSRHLPRCALTQPRELGSKGA